MGVNFRTSAGTDLDSLFSINNGNAGDVGFRASNGQDLGNRYTSASKLGYSVGYKNSAGTDLGYLRGNAIPPGISGHWANLSRTNLNWCSYRDYSSGGDNDMYRYTRHFREVKAYISCGLNGSGNGNRYHQVDICALSGSRRLDSARLAVWDNQDINNSRIDWSGYTNCTSNAIGANAEGTHIRVVSRGCDNAPRRNFTIQLTGDWKDGAQSEKTNVPIGVRIFQHFYSDYGDAGWVSNDIWFG